MKNFSYARAASSEEVVAQLGIPGRNTMILSGGMDLLDLLKEGLETPDVLVSLANLDELKGIEALDGGGVLIGARTTLAELAESPVLIANYSALALAAAGAATPQIRHRATLGGNVLQRPRCWYFRNADLGCMKTGGQGCPAVEGDNRYLAILGGGPCHAVHASSPATALVALGATVHVLGADGLFEIAAEDLFAGPQVDVTTEHTLSNRDLIVAFSLTTPGAQETNTYKKVRHKEAYDWAMAETAVWLKVVGGIVESCRIVIGGVAPVPWRASAAEQWLTGRSASEANLTSASALALADAQPLSDNAYKVPIARHVVEQALTYAVDAL